MNIELIVSAIRMKQKTKNISYCWNKDNEKWNIFDDSSFNECEEKDIYLGNPYLLLYERL